MNISLLILKNRIVYFDCDSSIYEYLIINTENNTFHRKLMTTEKAIEFSKRLSAFPIAPIDLIGHDYMEVKSTDFDYPFPF